MACESAWVPAIQPGFARFSLGSCVITLGHGWSFSTREKSESMNECALPIYMVPSPEGSSMFPRARRSLQVRKLPVGPEGKGSCGKASEEVRRRVRRAQKVGVT